MGKFLVVLIILAGGGYFAYSQGWLPIGEPSDDSGDQQDTTDQDGATLTPGGTSGSPLAAGGSQAAGPSAELLEALAAAEATWAGLDNPLQDPQAPALALTFSRVLRAGYGNAEGEALGNRLVSQYLTPLAERLFVQSTLVRDDPTGLFQVHTVASGETPERIGRSHGISSQMVNLLRAADPGDGNLSLGERLKVVHLKGRTVEGMVADGLAEDRAHEELGFYIHIDKSDYRLDLFVGGLLIRRFEIGIGAVESPTPVTTRPVQINMRELHMDWTHPQTNQVYPWNHPQNILGAVWIRLDAEQLGQKGIGIHGYNGEGSATRVQGSNGCIRMRNEDAELVYSYLTKVDPPESSFGFGTRAPMWVEIRD